MMITGRCAACKYLRRKCVSNCIFSPHFPCNDPERFALVHRIYGASNVAKMLQEVPDHQRGGATDTLCWEARQRVEDPVYGCVGIISQLNQHIQSVEMELVKTQAHLAFLHSSIHNNMNMNMHMQQEEQFQQIKDESVVFLPDDCAYPDDATYVKF